MATYANQIGVALASDDATSEFVGLGHTFRESAIYLNWGTGVTAGEVTIETASVGSYPGTDSWAPLAVVDFTTDGRSAPKADVIQITGAFQAIRARVTGALSGGTVDVFFVGN